MGKVGSFYQAGCPKKEVKYCEGTEWCPSSPSGELDHLDSFERKLLKQRARELEKIKKHLGVL